MSTLTTRDLVPEALRYWWRHIGHYPGRDLFTLFDEHAHAHPVREAVVDSEGVTTYRALHDAVLRLAGSLAEQGLRPGEVIAVQLPNSWRAVAVDLAAAVLGAVVLAYPVGRGHRDTLALLCHSRAALAVVTAQARDVLESIRGELPELRTVVVAGSPGQGLDAMLSEGPALRDHPEIDPASPVRILVSSGSEAAPKMVLYSHDALAGGRGTFVGRLHRGPGPMRNLFMVPLGSSFGSSGTAVTLARFGGTLLVQSRFDATACLELIATHRPHLVFGVPAMFQKLLASPSLVSTDTSSLHAVVAGGSRVDPATVMACRAAFGCAFVNCYGSADGVNCTTPLDAEPTQLHSAVGYPDPAVAAVRVVGQDGQDVPAGDVGEIWALGPMSPLCYVDPDLDTRYRAPGGWVRTGDLGRFGADGQLHVVGRCRDVVIRGGRNISPVEVELLVALHPAILAAACIGVPDPVLGERLAACMVVRPGVPAPTLPELTRYLIEEHGLETVKLPEQLIVLDELPLNAAGKVDKRALCARLSAGSAA
ncbi:MAG TPA: class I adenylate-forming enzyme family protein [Pseudonocardiaceae bacterium]|nr:class I adenylate-forming enzyme family protein [Pseudonocardiaceae bacterium]